jgi:hypothetical protein
MYRGGFVTTLRARLRHPASGRANWATDDPASLGKHAARRDASSKAIRIVPRAKVLQRPSSAAANLCTLLAQVVVRWGRTGGVMGDISSKIAGLRARTLRAGVHPLAMVALLLMGSPALAQDYRGTEQQRVACTPDVFRLCSWEIPNVDRIIICLRRERSQLSPACRQVFEIEAGASRAALNGGAGSHHVQHHFVRHRLSREYEKSEMRE